jgi:hypothetical protein
MTAHFIEISWMLRLEVLGDLEALTNFCNSYIGLAAQGTDIVNRKVTFDLPDEMGSDLPDKTALPAFVAVVVKQNHLESRMAGLQFLEDHVFDFGPGFLWLAHAQLP